MKTEENLVLCDKYLCLAIWLEGPKIMFTSVHSANGIIYYNGIVILCKQNANLQPVRMLYATGEKCNHLEFSRRMQEIFSSTIALRLHSTQSFTGLQSLDNFRVSLNGG